MRLANTTSKRFEEYQPYIDTLILPIGTIEAHGPHAPLGTDVLIPKKIAELIEGQLSGRIWTLPEIPFGHCFHLRDFPGTIDVPHRIFADYVHAVVSSFARFGIKNVVLLNGHGGNMGALAEVANSLTEEGLTVLLSNYWLDYKDAIREITAGAGHGGEDETSLVMALDTRLVELDLAGEHDPETPDSLRYPEMGRTLYPEGYSGRPQDASEDKGERLYDLIVSALIGEITNMWKRNS